MLSKYLENFSNNKDTLKKFQAMQQKVQNYIEKQGLLLPGAKIIVGVSGGTDSVVMLHILQKLGYKCIIAHCNFHLRTNESDRDEIFVRNLADEMKLACLVIEFETIKFAGKHKISIEMAARKLRYEWFDEMLRKHEAQAIAIAHNADDNIETLLMNLVRGTGIKGLTGIPVKNGFVVRPLLSCSRNEIENYLIENGLNFVEDSTNASSDYKRNKFRNEIIPLLEEINPSVRQSLYQTIDRFAGINSIYQQSIEKIKSEIVQITEKGFTIDIEKLQKQLQTQTVLYEILFPYGFHTAVIEQINCSLNSESGKLFHSESHSLLKDRKFLIINPIIQNDKQVFSISKETNELFQPLHLKISRFDLYQDFIVSKISNCIQIDEKKIQYPLTLRHWNEGDTFYPFGMNQRKKVSDFFTDKKMNLFDKKQCWLLLSGEDIVWIVGKRIDNRFRVTDKTNKIIQIEIIQE